MPEKHLYEYAVLRVVPRVEREEFMNIGVIVYCSAKAFLRVRFEIKEERLSVFSNDLDPGLVNSYLSAMEKICNGRKEGGTIGEFPLAARFRWLTASRSTVIQASKVHPGFCEDPEKTLENLFRQQVG